MKYGRLAARRPLGLRDLVAYLADPLPAGPTAVPAPALGDWGMLGNDRLGDCTIAGAAHLDMATAARIGDALAPPPDNTVEQTYLMLSGGQDTGLSEADVLKYWQGVGLFGSRIAGYAPVDHRNPAELRSVVAAFGGAYLGVVVPSPAQQQFASGQPWDLTGTAADREIEGGHCVPAVGYDDYFVYVVTWGAVQKATWRWMGTYLEEAWAVITPEDAQVDMDALAADLGLL